MMMGQQHDTPQASQRALRIAQEVQRRTACEHVRLTLNEGRQPTLTGSKVGGLPYWPQGLAYPTDCYGGGMTLVAQINCAELGLCDPLPQQGMLQWLVSSNGQLMYGCQGNRGRVGETFAVVYHATVDGEAAMSASALQALNDQLRQPVADFATPVKREVALDATREVTAMGVTDARFNRLFFDIVRDITGVSHGDDGEMWYDYVDNADALYLEQHLGMAAPCHQMLGYPVSSQDDPRQADDQADGDMSLLIELASQHSAADGGELVMWGDMGEGLVFIDRERLLRRDFSQVVYTWSCG